MKYDEQALAHVEADAVMGMPFSAEVVRELVQQLRDARTEEYERGFADGLVYGDPDGEK